MLTQMFDDVTERGAATTPPGMAHWIGTGPNGRTCRECHFFMWKENASPYATSAKMVNGGMLKDARCKKYQELASRQGGKIPPSAAACKHFQQADVIPTMSAPPKNR